MKVFAPTYLVKQKEQETKGNLLGRSFSCLTVLFHCVALLNYFNFSHRCSVAGRQFDYNILQHCVLCIKVMYFLFQTLPLRIWILYLRIGNWRIVFVHRVLYSMVLCDGILYICIRVNSQCCNGDDTWTTSFLAIQALYSFLFMILCLCRFLLGICRNKKYADSFSSIKFYGVVEATGTWTEIGRE